MNKKIGYVGLDPSTLEWLLTQLKNVSEYQSLSSSLQALSDGHLQALFLEMDAGAHTTVPETALHCSELTIQPKSRRVFFGKREISLTPKEFDILYFLASNRGEVFTKEQIYQAVWEDHYLLDDSNIMAFIRRLRKKIEPHPDAPQYILTIWGIGYTFNDQLE